MKRDRIIGLVAVLVLIAAVVLMTGAVSINGGRVLQSTLNYCAPAGGSTTTYTCNMAPPLLAYTTGACYSFKADVANTGASTINFNGLGAQSVVKVAGGITTALVANDMRAGQIVNICYDGTNMEMQSTLGNSGGANPAGSNSELQYRSNATTFGALTNTGPLPTASWTIRNGAVFNNFSAREMGVLIPENGSLNIRFVTQSLSAPPYTVIASMDCRIPVIPPGSASSCGLFLYDGTKLEDIELLNNNAAPSLNIRSSANVTTGGSILAGPTVNLVPESELTFKIVDNSTNRLWFYYTNGGFTQFFSEATAANLTPTAAGIGGLDTSATNNSVMLLKYWCVSAATTCNGL